VHRAGQAPDYVPPEVEFLRGDVRDRAAWERALPGTEAIFHLAAYQDLLPNYSKFFEVNTVGTALLYEIIVEKKLPIRKVVVASSQFVYGEGKYRCERDGIVYVRSRLLADLEKGVWEPKCPACGEEISPQPLTEDYANPRNQYSISKYSQELIGLNLGQLNNIPTVALRYSIVQGLRQSFRNAYSGVLRIFTLKNLQGEPAPIYEDGRQLRDYVNVEDVARANLLVLEDPRTDYQVFNVGGGKGYTVLEFAQIVAGATGFKGEPKITSEFRLGDTRHSVSDISKLQSLGWQPTKTPRGSVKDYLAWIKTQNIDKDYTVSAERSLRQLGTVRRARVD
jgi:dTDP-L-rhamnose 4-epimerase